MPSGGVVASLTLAGLVAGYCLGYRGDAPLTSAASAAPTETTPELATTLRLTKSVLPTTVASTDALVEIRGLTAESRSPPIALALVIDTSSSMTGNKLENAKKAARSLAARLGDDGWIEVISFDRTAATHPINAIDSLVASGNTCISCGLRAGYRALARAPSTHLRRLVLMSDGDANRGILDAGGLGLTATRGRALGVTTTVVGIGRGYNVELTEAIAGHGAGSFYFAYNSDALEGIVDRELELVTNTVARDVELEIETTTSARLAGELEAPGALGWGTEVIVPLGLLRSGETRRVRIPLAIAPGTESVDVVRVWLSYRDETGERRRVALRGAVTRSDSRSALRAGFDREAAVHVARMGTTPIVVEAMDLYRLGHRDAANARLRHAIARLEKLDDDRLAPELAELRLAIKNIAAYAPDSNGGIMTRRVNAARAFEIAAGQSERYHEGIEGNGGLYRERDLE